MGLRHSSQVGNLPDAQSYIRSFLCIFYYLLLVSLKENAPVCSGPSRFDWDTGAQGWVYRRTKANLLKLLESELEQLCGEPINLSSSC